MAAKFATKCSEPLVLVHATETPDRNTMKLADERLRQEVARMQKNGGTIEPVLVGDTRAAKALVDLAHSRAATLVVVSSATKGAVDRWTLGSVSEEIAESSPVPTLVVRNPAPFETWDWSGSTLKVLVALDFYSSSDGVLRWVKDLRRIAPCDIVVCHVNWSRWTPTPAEANDMPVAPANPPELQARLERELERKVRGQLGGDGWPIVVRARQGEPESAIIQIAEDCKADLIVVGTHQRHGFSRFVHGSVSRGLLHRAATNVACVPTAATFDPREAHIPEYRRVLVATDFSELGNAAVPFACGACAIGGLVRIVHVVPSSHKYPHDTELAELHAKLRALVPDEIGARAQPPEVQVLAWSDPAEAICREADRFGADLVCLASHGSSGSKALFGSVTQGVLKRIRRPLLIVRRPDE